MLKYKDITYITGLGDTIFTLPYSRRKTMRGLRLFRARKRMGLNMEAVRESVFKGHSYLEKLKVKSHQWTGGYIGIPISLEPTEKE